MGKKTEWSSRVFASIVALTALLLLSIAIVSTGSADGGYGGGIHTFQKV